MKPPVWMKVEPKSKWKLAADGRSVEVGILIRKWHPMFWWVVFQMLVLGRDPITRKGK